MIKEIDDTTYPILVDWWQRHNFDVIPRILLPRRGYIAYIDDSPVAASFLYVPAQGDGRVSFSCWFVRNPSSTPGDVDLAFDELASHLSTVSKQEGMLAVFTFTGIPALEHRLMGLGYIPVEEGRTYIDAFPQKKEG
jgi:hypothetical protein